MGNFNFKFMFKLACHEIFAFCLQHPLSHIKAVWACLMVVSLDKPSVPNLIPHEITLHSQSLTHSGQANGKYLIAVLTECCIRVGLKVYLLYQRVERLLSTPERVYNKFPPSSVLSVIHFNNHTHFLCG